MKVSSRAGWFALNGAKAGLFAILLLCFGISQASQSALARYDGKALQHAFADQQAAVNVIGNDDNPDTEAALKNAQFHTFQPVPAVLGIARILQFNSMVHQLRDRLMHAPPALL